MICDDCNTKTYVIYNVDGIAKCNDCTTAVEQLNDMITDEFYWIEVSERLYTKNYVIILEES